MSATTESTRVLLLPDWRGAGAGHWQTIWSERHGDELLDQNDWLWPKRGDWMARLDDAVLADERQVVLVAHGLGCLLAAFWSAHSTLTARIAGAMLVAPRDTEQGEVPPHLYNWRPISRQPLPFPSLVIAAGNDPCCTPVRSRAFGNDWGALHVEHGSCGHFDAGSALEDWPAGRTLLNQLLAQAFTANN